MNDLKFAFRQLLKSPVEPSSTGRAHLECATIWRLESMHRRFSIRPLVLMGMLGLVLTAPLILSSIQAQDKTSKTEPKTEKKTAEEAKSEPSVDEILGKYLHAIGKKETVEKLRSQIALASFESGEGAQKAEWIRKAPD